MKLSEGERRKTKRDKKAKVKYNKYKKGGRFRSSKVKEGSGKEE
jgi:hypothetical protein